MKRFEPEHVLTAVSVMQQCEVVALSEAVAVNAAQLAVNLNLSSADAIIYATSLQRKALLYTHDPDLSGLDHVKYIERSTHLKHQRTSA